jgi:hypothetical protein
MSVPSHILENFEMRDARGNRERRVVGMREIEFRMPLDLPEYADAVLDGFCNPAEMLSLSFVCKPVYLRLYRRRFKRSGTDRHYSNEYGLTPNGVKTVPGPGFF